MIKEMKIIIYIKIDHKIVILTYLHIVSLHNCVLRDSI